MDFGNYSSPHFPVSGSVATMMRHVLFALLPGSICMTWFFGPGVVCNLVLAALTAICSEAGMLYLRGKPVRSTLADSSALVTGILLALALPPLAPWWIPVIGTLFAVIVAKQLYGGIGYNPFNPAMAGYVVLLISFPLELTLWPAPHAGLGLSDTLALVFLDTLPAGMDLDTLTMATPMDSVRTRLGLEQTIPMMQDGELFGLVGAGGWEWVNFWFLIGGLWLFKARVIQWQIPASMLCALAGMALVFYLLDPETHTSPAFQLFSGAAMLGAFFIATDPVSASTTPTGRLFYGAGIGILTYIIRHWGGYPEGIAFAVLLMNMAAPTIDYYTQPRVFGKSGDET
ncbi:MAG: electron transport complex subunit RsxD [Gammaproteobacteria bacterium]|nr:MAG: electron transport complex subunit RsxD [Gammaproteobacteria bacterium]